MAIRWMSKDGYEVDAPSDEGEGDAAQQAQTDQGGRSYQPSPYEENVNANIDQPWTDTEQAVTRGVKSGYYGLKGAFTDDQADRDKAANAAYEAELFRERAAKGERGVPQSLDEVSGPTSFARYAGGQLAGAAPDIAIYGAGALAAPFTGGLSLGAATAADMALHAGENFASLDRRNPRQLEDGTFTGAPTDEEAGQAIVGGMATGALNQFGSGQLIRGGLASTAAQAVSKAGKGLVPRTLAGIGAEAAEQGGIGAAQTYAGAYGQSRPAPTAGEVAEGALGAAAMSLPFGALHGVRGKYEAPETKPIPDKTQGSTDLLGAPQLPAPDRPLQLTDQRPAPETPQLPAPDRPLQLTDQRTPGPMMPPDIGQSRDVMQGALDRGAQQRRAAATDAGAVGPPVPPEMGPQMPPGVGQARDMMAAGADRAAQERAQAAQAVDQIQGAQARAAGVREDAAQAREQMQGAVARGAQGRGWDAHIQSYAQDLIQAADQMRSALAKGGDVRQAVAQMEAAVQRGQAGRGPEARIQSLAQDMRQSADVMRAAKERGATGRAEAAQAVDQVRGAIKRGAEGRGPEARVQSLAQDMRQGADVMKAAKDRGITLRADTVKGLDAVRRAREQAAQTRTGAAAEAAETRERPQKQYAQAMGGQQTLFPHEDHPSPASGWRPKAIEVPPYPPPEGHTQRAFGEPAPRKAPTPKPAAAKPATTPETAPAWQDTARAAWKSHAGDLRDFNRSMSKILPSAKTAEEAASAIRDKHAATKSDAMAERLNAVHEALTGKTIEEASTQPKEGVSHATEARQQPGNREPQHPRDGEGGPPAETGGGRRAEHGGEETVRAAERKGAPPAEAKSAAPDESAAEGKQGAAAPAAAGRRAGAGDAERAGGTAERGRAAADVETKPPKETLGERMRKNVESQKSNREAARTAQRAAEAVEAAKPFPTAGGKVERGVEDTRGEIELREHNDYPPIKMYQDEGVPTNPTGMNRAQNHVVDYMNGEITRTELLKKLQDWAQGNEDVKFGHLNAITQRTGGLTKGEIDSLLDGNYHSPWEAEKAKPAAEAEKPLGTAEETAAAHRKAIKDARALAPTEAPSEGMSKIVKAAKLVLMDDESTPKQRQRAVDTLAIHAQLERDEDVVGPAKQALQRHATSAEQIKAQDAVHEEAAERLNIALENQEPTARQTQGTASAHDTNLYEQARDGMSARDALHDVSENHPNAEVRDLAREMRDKIGDDVTVRHATAAERAAAPENTVAEYKNGEVILHSATDAGQSLVHENVHAASERALDAGGKNAVEMRRLYAEAQKVKALADHYGLKNVKEFMAEAFSNPEFRDALRGVRAEGGNLWTRFKRAVARLLGKDPSLLDRVMEAGRGVMEEQKSGEHPAFSHGDGSRESLYRQMSTGTATGVSNSMSDSIGNVFKDAANVAKKVFVGSTPTHIIVRTVKHLMPSIEKLAQTMDERTAFITKRQRVASDVYTEIERARKAAGSLDRFNQVINDSSIAQIHPKEHELSALEEKSAAAHEKFNGVKDTDKEGMPYIEAKNELMKAQAGVDARKGWDKMTKEEKAAIEASHNASVESHKLRRDLTNDLLGEKAPPVHDIKGLYAPFKRHGDWVVSVKSPEYLRAEEEARAAHGAADGSPASKQRIVDADRKLMLMGQDHDHRFVVQAKNAREAGERADALRKETPGVSIEQFAKDNYHKAGTGYRDHMVTATLDKLEARYGDSPEWPNIKKTVIDTYMEHLPDGSAATLEARRKLIGGWSQDFSRSVLDRLNRDAFQLGTLKYGRETAERLRAMDKERRTLGARGMDTEGGKVQANAAYGEMSGRVVHQFDANNFTKAEKVIQDVAHTFYLGAAPANIMMNMMQTPMIAVPVMAGRHGWTQAWRETSRATQDTFKLFSREKGFDLKNAKNINEAERGMFERMQNLNLLDMTMIHETGRAGRGERIINPQGGMEKAQSAWQRSKSMLDLPVRYVEAVNRSGTALAAFRLAMKKGLGEEAATRYAADVLRDSHVDYSAQANSNIFKYPGARVLLQFKKFGLTMFHNLAQRVADATGRPFEQRRIEQQLLDPKLTDEARTALLDRQADLKQRASEGRKMMTGLLAMHQLMAGSLGLPFTGIGFTAADIIRGRFGDDEKKYDSKVDLENYMTDLMGKEAATVLMRGLPAAAGIDMSKRAGLADVVPFSQQIGQIHDSVSGGNPHVAEKVLTSMLGPAGGVGQQVLVGMQKMSQGDYVEGAASLMPLPLMRSLAKGYQDTTKGVMVGGKQVGQLNGAQAMLDFLGIPSTSINQTKDAAYAAREAASEFSQTRNRLIQHAAEAGGTSLPDNVKAFNARNPDSRITMGDVLKKQQAGKAPKAGGGGARGAQLRAIQAETSRFATAE